MSVCFHWYLCLNMHIYLHVLWSFESFEIKLSNSVFKQEVQIHCIKRKTFFLFFLHLVPANVIRCCFFSDNYDAATPVLLSWDGVFNFTSFSLFRSNLRMVIMTKLFNFTFFFFWIMAFWCLLWTKNKDQFTKFKHQGSPLASGTQKSQFRESSLALGWLQRKFRGLPANSWMSWGNGNHRDQGWIRNRLDQNTKRSRWNWNSMGCAASGMDTGTSGLATGTGTEATALGTGKVWGDSRDCGAGSSWGDGWSGGCKCIGDSAGSNGIHVPALHIQNANYELLYSVTITF